MARLRRMPAHALRSWVAGLVLAVPAAISAHAAPPAVNPTPDPTPSAPHRVLISGHSLTDQPLPDMLAAIAKHEGIAWDWQRQYMWGTSIRDRTAGALGSPMWSGYSKYANRQGEGLDILQELRTAGASPEPYDTLLITELHSLLGALVWNDTLRYLRHFHDRFIDANPRGTTWLYESWLAIEDKGNPGRWIAYERAASPLWRCVATRINVSLTAEGRNDRIQSLPASRALAHLVERATQAPGVEGLSGGPLDTPESRRAVVDRFFGDNVHLTRLGMYYVALVTSAALTGSQAASSWAPADVDAATAAALQREATAFLQSWRREGPPENLTACRRHLQRDFIRIYWSYMRDTYWIAEQGRLRASLRWLTQIVQWQWRVARNNAANPFYFDAETDKTYWLPAP